MIVLDEFSIALICGIVAAVLVLVDLALIVRDDRKRLTEKE